MQSGLHLKGDVPKDIWRPSYTRIGNKLFLFGGGGLPDNNLHVLDLDSLEWSKVTDASGTAPPALCGNTLSAYTLSGKDYICVFAGQDQDGQLHSEFYIFDVEARAWLDVSDVQKGADVPARYLHSATVVDLGSGPKLVAMGGFAKQRNFTHVVGALQVLCLSTLKWSAPVRIPQRYSHSSTLIARGGRSTLLALSGRDERGKFVSSDDSLAIDLEQLFLLIKRRSEGLVGASTQDSQKCWTFFNPTSGSPPEGYKGKHFAEVIGSQIVLLGQRSDWKDEPTSPLDSGRADPIPSASAPTNECSRNQLHILDVQNGLWRKGLEHAIGVHLLDSASIVTLAPSSLSARPTVMLIGGASREVNVEESFDSAYVVPPWKLGLRAAEPAASTLSRDMAALLEPPHWLPVSTISKIGPAGEPDFEVLSNTPDASAIKLHKLLLAARWPHFVEMLDSGMSESVGGRATIDEEYDALYALFYYLYTDSLPSFLTSERPLTLSPIYGLESADQAEQGRRAPTWQTACSLLLMSSLYTLPHLFSITAAMLLERLINIENAPFIYQAAVIVSRAGPDAALAGGQRCASPSGASASAHRHSALGGGLRQQVTQWCWQHFGAVVARFQQIEYQNRQKDFAMPIHIMDEEPHTDDEVPDTEACDTALEPWALSTFLREMPADAQLLPPHVASLLPQLPQPSSGYNSPVTNASAPSSATLGAQVTSRLLHPSTRGRVSPTLSDLASGRATPSNATGTVIVPEDLAVDHDPEA